MARPLRGFRSGLHIGNNTFQTQTWTYNNAGDLLNTTSGNGIDALGNPLNNGNTNNRPMQ